MIIVIELQCKDWEHEHVNAGFLYLLREARQKEDIVLCSAVSHAGHLNDLYSFSDNSVRHFEIDIPDKRKRSEELTDVYYQIITDILKRSGDEVTCCFLLSTNACIIQAVSNLPTDYSFPFFLVFHARFERELLGQNTSEDFYTLKNIMNSIQDPRISYICYSMGYMHYLNGMLNKESIDKIGFLHHPMIPGLLYRKEIEGRIKLLIYGAALNDNAVKCAEEICYDDELSKKMKIIVISSQEHPILKYNIVNISGNSKFVNYDIIDSAIQKCDFVLIPYDRKSYMMTASGIFWDAMRNYTPVLTLDSEYFRWYDKYGVGIRKKTCEELITFLKNYDRNAYNWKERIDEMEKEVFRDNIFRIRSMMGEC